MRKLMACLVMVGCCHVAVAGDATSVPPVTSNTANLSTTKPGVAGVLSPLVGQTISCGGTRAIFAVTESGPMMRLGGSGWIPGLRGNANGVSGAIYSTYAVATWSSTVCVTDPTTGNFGCGPATQSCTALWN